jgi:8-oxo-dGTP diphosphatase
MDDFRIAVKSFIVNNNNELLLLKRESKDPHYPDIWEIPGGRLALGESPFDGLKRETKEETGLDIEIKHPLIVRHFTRQDKQKITMLIFLCNPQTNSVKISKEHVSHSWVKIEDSKSKLHPLFHEVVDVFNKLHS